MIVLLQLIWKYRFHYVIVIPAILLILLFKFLPFGSGIYLSLIDYKPFLGIFGSPWVGFGHYADLFAEPAFRQALANTLAVKLGYMLLTSVLAFAIAMALSAIPSFRARSWLTSILLIPYVIPSIVTAYLVMLVLSVNEAPLFPVHTLVLGDAALFRPVLILVEALKTCGIPAVIALAAITAARASDLRSGRTSTALKSGVIPALRAIAAFLLLQLSTLLSPGFELVWLLQNPLVMETADTLDTFISRTGNFNGQFSLAEAAWVVQFAIQLACTAAAYLLVRRFFLADLFGSPVPQAGGRETDAAESVRSGAVGIKAAGTVLTLIFAGAALLPVYLLFVYPFVSDGGSVSLPENFTVGSFAGFAALYIPVTAVYLLLAVTLAYPLTVRRLPGRGVYKAFLLTAALLGPATLHEFVQFNSLGMTGTLLPVLLGGVFPYVSVFVIKGFFNSRYADLKAQAEETGRGELHAFFTLFIPKIWRLLAGLGILQFIWLWNGIYANLIYIIDPGRYSPATRFFLLMRPAEESLPTADILLYGGLVSLPPILLLLFFRRWLTPEAYVSQIRNL